MEDYELIQTVLTNSKYYKTLNDKTKNAKEELLKSWFKENKLNQDLLILYQKIRLSPKLGTIESLLDISIHNNELFDYELVKTNINAWLNKKEIKLNINSLTMNNQDIHLYLFK